VPETEPVVTAPAPVQAEKPKAGKFRRFLRIAWMSLAAVIIVFLLGAITDHLVFYSPMQANLSGRLTQAQDGLSQANQAKSDLQTQLNNLTIQLANANDHIGTLEQDQVNLQSELDSANQHVELLKVLVELKTAHLDLMSENIAGAKEALSGTGTHLENLATLVGTVDANLAANMNTRLKFILDGMDSDPTTAQADLGLLADNLQSVESLLFGK
jgi:F0F1-type ATP synthase membrane subunit b/b'